MENPAFDGEKAYEHVEHLSAGIGARLTGSPGEHKAATYIARVMRSYGLKVTRQRFPVVTYDNRQCTLDIRQGGRWRTLEAEPVMLSKSTPPRGVTGEIHFVETGQAEYLTPAVKGKVVLVCGPIAAEDRRRMIGYRPKALVSIDPAVREGPRRAVLGDENRRTYGNLPMVGIRHLDGVEIMRRGPGRARLVLRNTDRASYSLNVLGEKAGTDLADEIVVVCAHYDSHWRIPGAGDNAGGAGVMLELARVLAGRPSRRTVRFIAFGAEETGLHGSTFYANRLSRLDRRDRKKKSFDERVDKTECDRHRLTFNVDMHGYVLGTYFATYSGPEDLGASVRLLAKEIGMACKVECKPMSSDGTPLAAVGVPNVQFARHGGTTCYGHGPDDDVRWISPAALGKAGEFSERFLRRYVTDAAAMAFAREISEDQKTDIRKYFTNRKYPVPGEK